MGRPKVAIQPRKSIAILAVLSLLMVVLSYAVMLGIAALCVYGPYLLVANDSGLHIQLVILLLGGMGIAGVLLWSVAPRPEKKEAPGMLLTKETQPRIFAELEEISSALGEPMPREVYLIGQPNAFVSDLGGTFGFGSRRILAIGLPLFYVLRLAEWRAVLAHEFAHYYSGDTSLGPSLYRAQKAMLRAFENLSSVRGLARIAILQALYLFVFYILKGTFLLFLRVINLASRRKEFRADELACLVAGTDAMSSSLKKIRGAAAAWPTYWKDELVPFLENGNLPAMGDGFVRFMAEPRISEQVKKFVDKAVTEGKTNPYDTHPPLNARLAAISKMKPVASPEDGDLAAEILNAPFDTEELFIENMNPNLAKGTIKRVSWDEMGEKVMIPAWTVNVAKYSRFLDGETCETLPGALKKISEIAAAIENPRGRLWSLQQKNQKALQLFGMALGLALLRNGWKLNAQPASFFLYRGDERLEIFAGLKNLQQGKTTPEMWASLCEQWELPGLR
ncbi:MAG TPA: M48 family metallopeptidase [Candidatus Dormibacteraeota bacterium]|jgi:heat shock protein HtpX|nr:M48 family metallopeptidase [Candidatus Dormibacteraeota bacterium]